VDGYTNVSQVDDFGEPYERLPSFGNTPPCGEVGEPLCDQWPKDERPQPGDITGDEVFHEDNILSPTGSTVDRTQCLRVGEKRVAARKCWHGRPQLGFCAGAGFNPPDAPGEYPTPIAVRRFLTCTREAVVDYIDENDDPQQVSWSSTVSADRYSGVITGTASADPTDSYALTAQLCARIEPGTLQTLTPADFYFPDWHCGFQPSAPLTDSASSYMWALCALSTGVTWADLDANVSGGGVGASDGSGSGSFSDTSATASCSFSYVASTSTVTSISVTITLSDEYTHQMLRDDILNLLSTWPFTNNVALPWSQSAQRTVSVLVEHDDGGAAVPNNWGFDQVDPNYGLFDGHIKGEPFTLGWPDKLFGFEQEDWECDGSSMVVIGYGQWSLVPGIPNTATRWVTYIDATQFLQGAYLWISDYGFGRGAEAVAQKTVEAKVALNSYNMFGPCGAQRYSMDTRFASCITAIDGGTITTADDLSDPDRPNGPASWGYAVVFGGALGGKVFSVASAGANTIELSTEIPTNGNVGDAFGGWSGGSLGIIGVVRWPSSPPICGKVAISSAEQDGADVKVFATVPYLVVGDVVHFVASGAADTSLSSSRTVTDADISEGWFKVAGTYAGNEPLYAQCVKSQGAPLASWNSIQSRGDYVVETFAQDSSTFDFEAVPTLADGNIHYAECGAGIAVTPNGDYEATPTWNHYSFPGVVTAANAEARAGVKIIQRVIDPTWQAPLSCGDSELYCPPYVEAMTDDKHDAYVAAGAAPMPGDASWGDVLPALPPTAPGTNCPTGLVSSEAPWIAPC
jgi:hypothetical protein